MIDKKEYNPSVMVLKFTNDKVPVFVEPKSSQKLKYVKYGENNNYPNFLLTLFNRSAKHNAILTSKQQYITGQGWMFDELGMQGEEVVALKAFIDNPNPYETLKDLLNKTDLDNEIFGGCYLKIVSDKKGGISEIYHVNYCDVRSTEDNSEFYISDKWLNSEGGENTNIKEDEYKTLPPFDPSLKKLPSESIYYYKSYRPNINTYTLPEYIGAIPAIITDAEIANFHRAEIQNSFKGSKMIVFKNGVPSDEEMKSTERKLKAKFTPTDNAGSIVIDFVDDPQRVPEILDLAAGDFDKKYEALNDTIQQEIFTGHKITSPLLFGIRENAGLGNNANELVSAYNLFTNTYVNPKQKIQEEIYNLFAPVKGKLKIKALEPIMPSFSEQTLMTILTKDEMREIIGRKPLDIQTNVNSTISDALNSLSPLVANKVLASLSQDEIRGIVNKPPLAADAVLPTDSPAQFSKCEHDEIADDDLDFSIFSKYGEPIENFVSIKHKKFMFSSQQFALSKQDNGVLDLIQKTPNITIEDLTKILKTDKTSIIESLTALGDEGLIDLDSEGKISLTRSGARKVVPSFEELYIRYRYVLRPDAPALVKGGTSRPFCESMMANPRYFSKDDIDKIGQELGAIYGIPNYDAFRRRGGWYHDPKQDVNLPFCRHIWSQELVKKIR
jgi:hypothetical protein